MEFKELKRVNKPGYQSVTYKASSPLSIESIIKIFKQNEKGNYKLYYCQTSSYTESGNTKNDEFRSVEEIYQVKDFPNPNIYFDACFIDKKTNKYAFSICTDAGADNVYYIVDDNMVEIVEDMIARDSMFEEQSEEKEPTKRNITNK